MRKIYCDVGGACRRRAGVRRCAPRRRPTRSSSASRRRRPTSCICRSIVAKELGLYKKAGLDVDIVSLGDGIKVYRALLAGNIDFGLTPGAPTIIGTLQRRRP